MALNREERRRRIHYRIRKHVNGTPERPRLAVFRSNKQIYAQVIDDEHGVTLVAAASNDKALAAECKVRMVLMLPPSSGRLLRHAPWRRESPPCLSTTEVISTTEGLKVWQMPHAKAASISNQERLWQIQM